MKKFDLIIVNKGLPGLILACGLSRYFSIAIIEQNEIIDISQTRSCNVKEISFFNIISIKILKYLQAWDTDISYLLNSVYKLEILEKDNVIGILKKKI
ncbi:hypothetical protein [Candidatus Blochmanniella vafra]|nr:hypothetical protein [Candidatus Blochmannia vafer]